MEKNYDYAIIGGGITGLASAFALSKQSESICLIEPGALGGSIQSKLVDGFTLELGATTLVLTDEIRELLNELELDSSIGAPVIYPYQQYVWHNGSPHRLPKDPFGLFRSKLFSFSEKLQLIKGIFKKINLSHAPSPTLAELFTQLIGRAPVERALGPALRGIYGGDIFKLQAHAVFPKIYQHLAEDGTLFQYLKKQKTHGRKIFHTKGGNNRIILALNSHINNLIVYSDRVLTLKQSEPESFELLTAQSGVITAKKVIVTTSGSATADFISPMAPDLARELKVLRYAPITVVHIALPRSSELLENAFGILFPATADTKIIGVLFNSQLFPWVAPENQHLVTVCLGGINALRDDRLTDDEIKSLVLGELSRLLNLNGGKVLSIHRWDKAIPQYESGFKTLQELFVDTESRFQGLSFLGVDRGGVSVPDRIRMGQSVMSTYS